MDIRRIFGAPLPLETETVQEQIQTTQEPQQPVGLPSQDSLEAIGNLPIDSQVTGGKLETHIPDLQRFLSFPTGYGSSGSISQILNYFGVSLTPQQVEQQMGKNNFSPEDTLNFYRSQGLQAEGYNNSSFDQMTSFIDQGFAVQAGIKEHSFDIATMITVTGHGVDNSRTPPQEYILYEGTDGKEHRMSRSQFEEEWARGGSGGTGLDYGYHNYMQVIGPSGSDLPAGNDEGAESVTTMQNGVTDLWQGGDAIAHGDSIGDRFHGLFQSAGGVLEIFGGGAGFAAFSAPAQALGKAVEGIPVLENFVQPLCDLWDTGGAIIGDVFEGLGSSIDDFGGAFGSLLDGDFVGFSRGLYQGVADVASAAVDTVVDTVEGVVDAVGDIFSGW